MIRKGSIYTSAELIRHRGWNENLISDVLGDPDVIQSFPRDPGRKPELLYLRKRVETLEERDDVAAIVLPRLIKIGEQRRSAMAKKLVEAAATAEIVITEIPITDLKTRAIEAFYERLAAAAKRRKAPDRLDARTMSRIYLKYAIGKLVDYDRIIAALPAPLDKPDVYALCRERIEAAVLATYPQIAPPVEEPDATEEAAPIGQRAAEPIEATAGEPGLSAQGKPAPEEPAVEAVAADEPA